MRQGQQNKRMRGRNRKGPNPLTRSYESNGGDVKLRGTALHIAEKYVQLARDAQSSSDRVAAENYFQHAEHYYRIVAAAQAQMPQPQPIVRNDEGDYEDEGGEFRANGTAPGGERPPGQQGAAFGLADPQPFLNGAEGDDDGGDGTPEYNDGFPQPREQNNGGSSGGGGQRYQGNPQGQGHRQEGQGHFRRRRPFRERYNERDNRDRNAQGGGERSDRPEGEGGQGQGGARPETPSESNED